MKFWDYTIRAGRKYAHRLQDTTALDPLGIALTSEVLRDLRQCGGRVPFPAMAGIPGFDVMLDLPDDLVVQVPALAALTRARGRCFFVAIAGEPYPFQYNLVLPPDDDPVRCSADRSAISALARLSARVDPAGQAAISPALVRDLWARRPVLATTLLPAFKMTAANLVVLGIASGFSKHFAAAMLTATASARV